MAKDWHDYLKKYVWDEDKTPFLIAVGQLNKTQARNEVFLYALFLTVPAALVVAAVTAYSLERGLDAKLWVGLYAGSVCVVAAWMHVYKSRIPVYYSMTAPAALLAYLLLQGRHSGLGPIDQMLIAAVLLLWFRYTFRVAAIARRYPAMPESPRPA